MTFKSSAKTPSAFFTDASGSGAVVGASVEKSPLLQIFQRFFSHFDPVLNIAVFLLLTVGVAFIYGTGHQVGDEAATGYWIRQCNYIAIGMCFYFGLAFFDYRWLGPLSILIYPVAIILLLSVLVWGREYYGAKRWLSIGSTSVQPSEFAKIAVVITLSWVLSLRWADINKIQWGLIALLICAFPFILIYKQPDLGTALVLVPAAGAIIFAAKLKIRTILIIIALAAAAAPVGYSMLEDYQKERIRTFLDPGRDPKDRGWNAIQAETAVGRGGFSGQGYMQGTHCTLGYLPKTVANSDFIFLVIAEETGFLGALGLLIIYGFLLYAILRTALIAPDAFGRYLCVGIGAMMTMHITVNIGMSIGLAPITGLPLPLVSFGGTFMLSCLICLGIVQSVYAHRDAESIMAI